MKKLIGFILYLLYNYYNDDNWGAVAYQVSIMAFLGLLLLNIYAIMVFFDLMRFLSLSITDPKWLQYLKLAVIYLLPGYIILSSTFKKNYIIGLNYSEDKIQSGNIFLVFYLLFSIAILTIVVLLK